MTSAIKSFLILLAALPLLIFIGNEVGSDEYFVPFAVGISVASAIVIALFFRGQRLECLVLTFLIGGYMIGCRGFAQLAIVQPLFVGELGLGTIIAIVLIRYAATRDFVVPKHWLATAIGFYLALAFFRLCFDYQTYNLEAVRDSAIIYYALFFFIAYQLGRREEVVPFVNRTMVFIIVLQAVVAVVFILKPDWLDLVEVRGVSPLLQKTDLTGTFCAIGAIFLALHPELIRTKWFRSSLVLLLCGCVIMLGSRAATVAMLITLPLIWISGRRGFIVVPSFLLVFGMFFVLTVGPLISERFLSVQEEFASVLDVSGNQHYSTDFGEEKRADNRFRLLLWQSMYDQTVQDNWVIGKGFGYDFIPIFEQEFNGGHWEGLRSAHNYFVTAFSRLGASGSLVLISIVVGIGQGAVRSALALRRQETTDTSALSFWCLGIIIMVSGTFGVVMEGPMGAIPMWSFFGLALASDDRWKLLAVKEEKLALPIIETSPEARRRPFSRPAVA